MKNQDLSNNKILPITICILHVNIAIIVFASGLRLMDRNWGPFILAINAILTLPITVCIILLSVALIKAKNPRPKILMVLGRGILLAIWWIISQAWFFTGRGMWGHVVWVLSFIMTCAFLICGVVEIVWHYKSHKSKQNQLNS